MRPLLLHRMAFVSFRLYVSEKFAQLARIFWANGLPPPGKRFPGRTPMRTDVLEGHDPFYLNFFLQKMFARLTLQFPFTYICICNRVGTVSFSDGGLRDRDIIFRDENESCILFP